MRCRTSSHSGSHCDSRSQAYARWNIGTTNFCGWLSKSVRVRAIVCKGGSFVCFESMEWYRQRFRRARRLSPPDASATDSRRASRTLSVRASNSLAA